jgi:hypothetical protein
MSEYETSDHHWVPLEGVEFWIRKAEDNSEDRSRNIAEQNGEEDGYLPVSAAADDEVEITAELVALS